MPTYIGLLRGVNVGGNFLKMERLRDLCAELGFQNVRTYVQSGNVVFESAATAGHCLKKLQGKLAGETRLPVAVVLRTVSDLRRILAGNAFLKRRGVDPSKLHVTFLGGAPTKEGLKKLGALKAGDDEFRVVGEEVYLYCPDGYGRTKLSNNALEKGMGTPATTRNWNTVNKLYEIATG
jgi:uncharacterized protein (DUF1697 family)